MSHPDITVSNLMKNFIDPKAPITTAADEFGTSFTIFDKNKV